MISKKYVLSNRSLLNLFKELLNFNDTFVNPKGTNKTSSELPTQTIQKTFQEIQNFFDLLSDISCEANTNVLPNLKHISTKVLPLLQSEATTLVKIDTTQKNKNAQNLPTTINSLILLLKQAIDNEYAAEIASTKSLPNDDEPKKEAIKQPSTPSTTAQLHDVVDQPPPHTPRFNSSKSPVIKTKEPKRTILSRPMLLSIAIFFIVALLLLLLL